MSLFIQKNAIESNLSSSSKVKSHKRSKSFDGEKSTRRSCRIEELEKREYLSADPVDIGIVYSEQYSEDLGDRFYVAWVGGEDGGCTTLDSLVINLDKNGNGSLDEGEAYFDQGQGVYSHVENTLRLVDKSSDIDFSYDISDNGTVLTITFDNFHAGDTFVFEIDLDEYQTDSSKTAGNAQVEGGEMGGSLVNGIAGSKASATFSSVHYQTETWAGMFVDEYDEKGEGGPRSVALSEGYDRESLPYDVDDGNEGIAQAGVYGNVILTPKPIVISGYVYEDLDVDCNKDDGEPGLAGYTITLYGENDKTWTTTTNEEGFYLFEGDDLLPGSYLINSSTSTTYIDFCAKGGEFGEKIDPTNIKVGGMQGGDVAPNNNFAKVLPSSIEGNIFEDLNDANGKEEGENWDGIQHPATVELYRISTDESGNETRVLMETQKVDAEGRYKFLLDCSYNAEGTLRKLPCREYEVRMIFDEEANGYSDGKDYIGREFVGTDDTITDIWIGYNEHLHNYDFGKLKLGSISGNVYEDRNSSGAFDKHEEPGIGNVTVGLYRLNGSEYEFLKKVATNKDGYYEFNDLDIEQTYAVKEIHPEDYVHGDDTVGSLGGKTETGEKESFTSEIVVGWDDHGVDYNFGELKLGSISGNVYEDRNDNGVLDDGDVDLSGVTISLYRWNGSSYDLLDHTKTDENGNYSFDNLDINQKYAVREDEPEGYSHGKNTTVGTLGGERVNTNERLEIKEVSVKWDEHGVDYNFGELKLGSIEGTVYEDRNDDGVYNDGDFELSGVVVELLRWDGDGYKRVGETKTNSDGSYRFDNLDINQKYAVRETEPEGYEHGKNLTVGTLGGERTSTEELQEIKNVVVEWGDVGYDYDFGELRPGSISGTVYEDRNDNGIYDDRDVELAGVTVELLRWNGSSYDNVSQTTTDENGYYCFTGLEIATQYAVRETEPEGYKTGKNTTVGNFGGDRIAGQGVQEIKNVPIGWNDFGYDYNFGELKPGSIEGIVYEDRNDNGVHDGDNEVGIPGVRVALYKQIDGEYVEVASTITDADGKYKFEGLDLDFNYGVLEDRTAIVDVYEDGDNHVGTLGGVLGPGVDFISQINVQWDDQGKEYDYGELKLGSISGYVYNDVNDNGVREENLGEKGIPNTIVELYQVVDGEYVKIDETKTDANGYYEFNELDIEQTYGVKEIQPEGWDDGKNAVGSLGGELVDEADWTYAIPVGWADEGVEYDFGELEPPIGSLSGYVYEDLNDNGVREEELGEKGIKNVEVQLFVADESGKDVYVSSTTTDDKGYYEFTELPAGKVYMIHEIQPTEYDDGKDAVGTIFGATVGELGENDYLVNILLPKDGAGVEYDFGELIPLQPGSISGYVYFVQNVENPWNTIKDSISNVLITLNALNEETGLYVSTGRTALTDSNGYYVFENLEPNRYYQVVEAELPGRIHAGERVGTINGEKVGAISGSRVLSDIYVGSGEVGVHYDFAESYTPIWPNPPSPIPPTPNTWAASPTVFSYVNNQPYVPGSYTTLYGGGGFTENYSFRLSVLDDGSPRSPEVLYATNGFRGNYLDDDSLMLTVSSSRLSDAGEWLLCDKAGNVVKQYRYGADGAKAIVGNWNGDRTTHIGIFVDGRWYLDRNGDGKWDSDDLWADLGAGTDQPVSGDWNGDGKDDIGIFGPQWASDPLAIEIEPGLPSDLNRYVTVSRAKNLPPDEDVFKTALDNIREAANKDTGKVRRDLVDHVFEYGSEGDIAVTGDWNGDGITKIGVYRNGEWYLDMNGDGRWNEDDVRISNLGGKGYIPVVGDFDGDGVDTVGLFHNGEWLIDVDGDHRLDRTISFGQEGDQPVVGDWDGDGIDEIGVYRPGSSVDSTPEDIPTNAQNSASDANQYAMN